MHTLLKSGNAKLYTLLGSLFVLASAWRVGDAINLRLFDLPVIEAPRVDSNSAPITVKSFYPVWVKQAAAIPPGHQESDVDSVDALFGQKLGPKIEPPKPLPQIEPDYMQMFQQAARVDGVSDDGAFVNGRFYKVGQKMEDFRVSGLTGQPVVPVIESIKAGKITFTIGKQKVFFQTGGVS